MKIILHIGMPRAGSNAIQSCLFNSRDNLIKKGILFPISNVGPQDRHHALSIPAYGDVYTAYSFSKMNKEEKKSIFNRFFLDLKSQVAENKPDYLILSTETLFLPLIAEEELTKQIFSLSTNVEIVGVVRNPINFYESLIHEILKRTHRVPKFDYQIKEAIESYTQKFSNIKILNYEGDSIKIVRDILKDKGVTEEDLNAPTLSNASTGGEGTKLLQLFRRYFHIEDHWQRTKDTEIFLEVVARVENKIGKKKLELKPHVKNWITAETETTMKWLQKQYEYPVECKHGEHDNIEYYFSNQVGFDTNLSDLIEIDEILYGQLIEGVINTKWASNNDKYKVWLEKLAKNHELNKTLVLKKEV